MPPLSVNILSLIIKEIRHRKLGAAISVITIAVALTCIIASMETMRKFDQHTEEQLATLSRETDATTEKLNDQIRRTMKGLGFNVHIYPASQDLSEVYAKGYASNTMPESYASTLADSKIVSVNHLLPRLSRRILWKEKNAEIMLIGVDGQVPISHRNPQKPIMLPVPQGAVIVGSQLALQHQLKKNQTFLVQFLEDQCLGFLLPCSGNIRLPP